MNVPRTITVPRWTYMTIVICLVISTASHLFRIVVDFTR